MDMVTYDALKSLTEQDIAMFGEIRPILNEAEETERLINDTWLFRAGEKEVMVWKDDEEGVREFVSYDGNWRRDVSGWGCNIVKCDAATIFEYFKAEFLFKNYCACVVDDDEMAKKAGICKHLRKFVERTREKHDGATR